MTTILLTSTYEGHKKCIKNCSPKTWRYESRLVSPAWCQNG